MVSHIIIMIKNIVLRKKLNQTSNIKPSTKISIKSKKTPLFNKNYYRNTLNNLLINKGIKLQEHQ